MSNKAYLAAVDLGSNSFRCEIGRLQDHHGARSIVRADYLKETVRLGGGLDKQGRLSEEAMSRGLSCLERFAERIRDFHPDAVRAVATQTLREASNRDEFIKAASKVLGFPIEVISGREEARLIYSGVAHLLPDSDEQRLVIDIGGRSTEIILGKHLKPQIAESYQIGSVSLSQRYFAEGKFTEKAFDAARISAAAALEESLDLFSRGQWDTVYGSSGTVSAMAELLQANEIGSEQVTLDGLAWCREKLLKAGSVEKLKLSGIKEDRKAVIGGGITILEAFMQSFGIQALTPAKGALRQGVLFDMLGRKAGGQRDLRNETVMRLQNMFHADPKQAVRVEQVALALYDQLAAQQQENSDVVLSAAGNAELRLELSWACRLHEIGMTISHSEYHRHGAYIIEKADAAGFSQSQQQRIAQLVLGHRGGLRKVLTNLGDVEFSLQLMALRLAAILCHARRDPEYRQIQLKLQRQHSGCDVELSVNDDWVSQHPLSVHLLIEEAKLWGDLPSRLMIHLEKQRQAWL